MTFSVTGCISADETGDCLFLSDSNHHRIIISNNSGEILDSVSVTKSHLGMSKLLLEKKKGSCEATCITKLNFKTMFSISDWLFPRF